MSADRAASILARFNAAHHALVGALRELPPEVAERRPSADAWSAAQIGCHVAMTNQWAAGILSGTTPMAQPAPAGFTESFAGTARPARVRTSPAMEPPAVVSCEVALERLRESCHHLSKAIASLSAERGSGYTVTLRFGTLSLFELADFIAGHVARHLAQVERTVGDAASSEEKALV